jgi:hypothetical protein
VIVHHASRSEKAPVNPKEKYKHQQRPRGESESQQPPGRVHVDAQKLNIIEPGPVRYPSQAEYLYGKKCSRQTNRDKKSQIASQPLYDFPTETLG